MSANPRWLIVGAGSFGTAMARILGPRDVDLTIAARSGDHVAAMRESFTNERYFPGIRFPHDTKIVTIDDAAESDWDVIVLAVPASAVQATIERFADRAPLFLSLGKGLDPAGRRMSEVAADYIDADRFVALSGPNIAREMMRDLPTAAVIASTSDESVLTLQEVLNGYTFRVYASGDVVGVELAGASKNVIAIAAGVLDGLGLGDNAIAAMMTRGLGEMARLGLSRGALLQTYLGLAGVGDLMVTCRSPHSRNNRAGHLIAAGHTADEVRAEIGQVVEGMRTAPVVRAMGLESDIEMHICDAVAAVVSGEVELAQIARDLMNRAPGYEFVDAHEFEL